MMRPSIGLVVPALNEARNLPATIRMCTEAFHATGLKGEIIVVDDGSTDDTKIVLASLQAQVADLKVISNGSPSGLGGAFWTGVKACSNDFVVVIPGDGEIDPKELFQYEDLLSDVDLLIPYVTNRASRGWVRVAISVAFTMILNFTFGKKIKYYNGAVVYRRALLEKLALENKGFFYQAELILKAIQQGARYKEVPYLLKPRLSGKSTSLSWKTLARVVSGYIKLVWQLRFTGAQKSKSTTQQLKSR